MIVPDKHLRIAESLLGLGGFVLEALDLPKSIDTLWSEYQEIDNTERFPAHHSFENLILAIVFLYTIGAITEDDKGRLIKCA